MFSVYIFLFNRTGATVEITNFLHLTEMHPLRRAEKMV